MTKEAACEAKGVKTYTCSVCKASYTEEIPAKGHDWKKQTVHRDAVYGTRDITETRSHVTVYLLMYLNQKGIDAGLANNDEFGIAGAPAFVVIIGEYWETNGNESTREWVYKWQENSSNDINAIAAACVNDYISGEPYKGSITSYGTKSYIRSESRVVGTEEYLVTPAHDEEATVCTRCGADKDLISFTNKIYQILISFKSKYPEGTSWTNENRTYVSYTICPEYAFYTGYGCEAFTTELSDAAFGDLPRVEHHDVSRIRVGDILRINNNTHAVIVLEVTSSGVVVAEGNYNGKVHWGRVISNEELKNCLTYVWTRYPS